MLLLLLREAFFFKAFFFKAFSSRPLFTTRSLLKVFTAGCHMQNEEKEKKLVQMRKIPWLFVPSQLLLY